MTKRPHKQSKEYGVRIFLHRKLAILFFVMAGPTWAQTVDEAINFVKTNMTGVKEMTCQSVKGTIYYPWGSDPSIYAYEFDPRLVEIGNKIVTCVSGLKCIKHARSICRVRDCEGTAKRYFERGENIEQVNNLILSLETSVEEERITKAWDFFVNSCGGRKKSSF